jgi:hypothetical protein
LSIFVGVDFGYEKRSTFLKIDLALNVDVIKLLFLYLVEVTNVASGLFID